jgi:hypothetical protein
MNPLEVVYKPEVQRLIQKKAEANYNQLILNAEEEGGFEQFNITMKYFMKKFQSLNFEDKIVVFLKCPITMNKITIPARGSSCKHYECVDFENLLYSIIEKE